jgi:hypothetical protein
MGLGAVATGVSVAPPAMAAAATITLGSPVELSGPGSLAGVSCSDATDCTAVGRDGQGQPFYMTETGGVWGSPTELAFPGGSGSFTGVSCSDTTDCTAVGDDVGHGYDWPIHAIETGGEWSTPTEIAGRPAGNNFFVAFLGVSCVDATDCTAVGQSGTMGGNGPIYATEAHGVWSALSAIPNNTKEGSLASISCTSASNCTAVGNIGFGNIVPGYASETNGAWSIPSQITGTLGSNGTFSGVSCAGPGDCTAVGTGSGQPMYATEKVGDRHLDFRLPGGFGKAQRRQLH